MPGFEDVLDDLRPGGQRQFDPLAILALSPADGLRVLMHRIPSVTEKSVLKQPFLFQVPPTDALRRSYSHGHSEYDTIESGQFSRKGARQLVSIQFATLFLDDTPFWTLLQPINLGGGPAPAWRPNPIDMTDQLRSILDSGTPFNLVIGQPALWGSKLDVNMKATLRDLTVEERAGEIDARYLDVTFREYRAPKAVQTKRQATFVRVFKDGHAVTKDNERLSGPVTLHKLAKRFYGSPSRWTLIAKRNGIKNWAPSRSLGEWVKKRKRGVTTKLVIPAG